MWFKFFFLKPLGSCWNRGLSVRFHETNLSVREIHTFVRDMKGSNSCSWLLSKLPMDKALQNSWISAHILKRFGHCFCVNVFFALKFLNQQDMCFFLRFIYATKNVIFPGKFSLNNKYMAKGSWEHKNVFWNLLFTLHILLNYGCLTAGNSKHSCNLVSSQKSYFVWMSAKDPLEHSAFLFDEMCFDYSA